MFQAAMWFASDYADYAAVNESETSGSDLGAALGTIGASDDIAENVSLGTDAFALWLLEQLQTTALYKDGEAQTDQVLRCAMVDGTGIIVSVETIDDAYERLVETFAQVYAGRYDLPGEQLSESDLLALESQLDPDGDGIYYTHKGQGDSEDFLAPPMLRVTYTGTGPTCAFNLLTSATGTKLDFVSGLDGGGFVRLVLPLSEPTNVYVSDVIGCRGGELQFGPNP